MEMTECCEKAGQFQKSRVVQAPKKIKQNGVYLGISSSYLVVYGIKNVRNSVMRLKKKSPSHIKDGHGCQTSF